MSTLHTPYPLAPLVAVLLQYQPSSGQGLEVCISLEGSCNNLQSVANATSMGYQIYSSNRTCEKCKAWPRVKMQHNNSQVLLVT